MEIKLLATPLGMEWALDWMEEHLDTEDPLFICIHLNQMVKDGFSDKQIAELVGSIAKGELNTIHLMQPKDNEFYYTDEWLGKLYTAWNTLRGIHWWQPSQIPDRYLEGSREG